MKGNSMEQTTEVVGPIVATEATQEQALADLDRRIREIETAIGDLQSVKASASQPTAAHRAEAQPGRKTHVAVMAKGTEPQSASVDDALRSLSVEQRIAVKSGLMRAGLL
jgi:hypothetical protein